MKGPTHNKKPWSSVELSEAMNRSFPPTEEQQKVIEHPAQPLLVVAGAGAGKTETMASRVVWMVANGYVRTDQVLGLTFTRKAASELNIRIRRRLETIARSELITSLPMDDPRRQNLQFIHPTVQTYDSFVGDVISEFGLLLPVEPTARLINPAERWIEANRTVQRWDGTLRTQSRPSTMVDRLLKLNDVINGHLVDEAELAHYSSDLIHNVTSTPGRSKNSQGLTLDLQKVVSAQQERIDLLALNKRLKETLADRGQLTFGEQMAAAARLAVTHPEVGRELRHRFKVIILDEYQDTGTDQKVFLSALFADPQAREAEHNIGEAESAHAESETPSSAESPSDEREPAPAVTAVGDPMQCIYTWRGATPANLKRFSEDFAYIGADGRRRAAQKRELTTSFRNPSQVLDLANIVSDEVLTRPLDLESTSTHQTSQPGKRKRQRFVSPLVAGIPTKGTVSIAWKPTEQDELTWLVEKLTQEFDAAKANSRPFEAAVLVRTNAQASRAAEAIREAGIPVEVTGDALHAIPEVGDVLAVLKVLIDPSDDAAMLRILAGPRWRLGAKDLHAVAARAQQLSVSSPHPASSTAAQSPGGNNARSSQDDPYQRFLDLAESLDISADHTAAGLTDAVADSKPADAEGSEEEFYSPEAAERIRELSAILRGLRTSAMPLPLPDLLAAIEQAIGIRAEVYSRADPSHDAVSGSIHLDRLIEEAENLSQYGADAAEFLEYIEASEGSGRALAGGEVIVRSQRVQVMTIHKAKGLEWDTVAIPFCDTKSFIDESTSRGGLGQASWLTTSNAIPSELRGDCYSETNPEGLPLFDAEHENQSEFKRGVDAFKSQLKTLDVLESDRLFYVAITRSSRRLILSGNADTCVKPVGEVLCEPLKARKKHFSAMSPDQFNAEIKPLGEFTSKNAAIKSLTAEINELANQDLGYVEAWNREPAGLFFTLAEHLAAKMGFTLKHDRAAELEKIISKEPPVQDPLIQSGKLELTPQGSPEVHLNDGNYEIEWSRCNNTILEELPAEEDQADYPLWPNDPLADRRSEIESGIALVTQALEDLEAGGTSPQSADGTLAELWNNEVTALIEEANAASRTVIEFPLGSELSTSELISASADPESFARRQLRPRPFQPNLYAKRGTAFHNWLEERSGGSLNLLDEDDIAIEPDYNEDEALVLSEPELDKLKDAFRNSTWADKTPAMVELPFVLKVGNVHVKGRMDAVFHEGDDPEKGWTIIDWKTGRKPEGSAMQKASIQLAIYREALMTFLKKKGYANPEVTAAFHYVRANETYAPGKLPTAQEIADGTFRTFEEESAKAEETNHQY